MKTSLRLALAAAAALAFPAATLAAPFVFDSAYRAVWGVPGYRAMVNARTVVQTPEVTDALPETIVATGTPSTEMETVVEVDMSDWPEWIGRLRTWQIAPSN